MTGGMHVCLQSDDRSPQYEPIGCCHEDTVCVEGEESSSTTVMSTQNDEAMIVPAASRLRLHRSAVRPFFCCGSELSLISISEGQEVPLQDKPSSSDCVETDLESSGACAETSLSGHSEDGGLSEAACKPIRERVLRKKNVDGFPRKMSRKSWAVKLRGKLPKRLKNVDEHGNLAASGSGIETGCTCTAYRQTDGQPGLYCYGAASPDNVSVPAGTSFGGMDMEPPPKTKSGKGKGRAKPKPLSGSNQVGISASNMLKAWMGADRADTDSADDGLFSPAFHKQCAISSPWAQPPGGALADSALDTAEEECQYSDVPSLGARAPYISVHSQVDYVHCLVPDLACIANCSFYWGVMDRYEAEKLLENKPEGTFLLRDSAQDEFLFSVSFRRYGRSLHARVEQFNHKFSFDSHDPGVFATDTVCGLIEHYKDPSCCMFFEPMLTLPINRSFPFSLQHLCRSAIVSTMTYDGISQLPLPNSLQEYLRYYHYKHKVGERVMASWVRS